MARLVHDLLRLKILYIALCTCWGFRDPQVSTLSLYLEIQALVPSIVVWLTILSPRPLVWTRSPAITRVEGEAIDCAWITRFETYMG